MKLLIYLYVVGVYNTYAKECNDDISMEKGKLAGTISLLSCSHVITFSVKPTLFTKGWSNVIHFTTGGDDGDGKRIPGVWFDFDKLQITNSVNGNPNYTTTTKSLTKGHWSEVTIMNLQVGSKYMYIVYVNGEKIVETENSKCKDYKNVKVYVSDPWYRRFAGSICNLMISAPGGEIKGTHLCPMNLFFPGEDTKRRKKLVGTILELPAIHIISFSVKPKYFIGGYSSVLQMTTSKEYDDGKHVAGAWFRFDQMIITATVNGDSNYMDRSQYLKRGEWADVRIISTKIGLKYMYEVYVNGKQIARKENPTAHKYESVKIYAPDPWHRPFDGSIRNLIVSFPGSFVCS